MNEELSQLRKDLLCLIESQKGMITLREILDQKDATSDKISDVWNLVLDLRDILLDRIISNPVMQIGGCNEILKRKLMQRFSTESLVSTWVDRLTL